MKSLSREATNELQNAIQGRVVLPNDPDYDEVRKIWNGMIDRRPAVIARCSSAADVPHAIRFAGRTGLDISIRGAGHNIAGNALCEGGLMIDLSTMKKVRVDPAQRRAFVEPGVTLADLDEATQAHGLATPVGINSTTGISGLTLGGGFGWLTRKYGLTVDNLVAADLVTAAGQKVRASDDENPDLFWAIRGGGGNFGVVTQFEFKLHPVGPEILAGLIVFPLHQAKRVLTLYREFVESAPQELSVWVVLRQAPPLPFLPAEVHGKEVVVLAVFYAGDIAEGERLTAPLRNFGDAYGEHLGAQPYAQWQKAFDPLLTPGARNYWKSHNFTELADGALDTMIEFAGNLPSPQCEIFLGLLSGVANDIPADAMAYSHRDAKFVLNVHTRWEDAAHDKICIEWARSFFSASAPYASSGAYVNFMTEDEGDEVAGLWRQLWPAGGGQETVRSGQHFPYEPQHQTLAFLTTVYCGAGIIRQTALRSLLRRGCGGHGRRSPRRTLQDELRGPRSHAFHLRRGCGGQVSGRRFRPLATIPHEKCGLSQHSPWSVAEKGEREETCPQNA